MREILFRDLVAEVPDPIVGLMATGEGDVEVWNGDTIYAQRILGPTRVRYASYDDATVVKIAGEVQLGALGLGGMISWITQDSLEWMPEGPEPE